MPQAVEEINDSGFFSTHSTQQAEKQLEISVESEDNVEGWQAKEVVNY